MVDPTLKATLKKKYGDEQVYVVPFQSVKHIPDKFTSPFKLTADEIYGGGQLFLRCDAEYNPAMIQLIPYIIVVNKAHDKIYVTKRIAGEERLKDTLALGCGGHINACDYGHDIITNAALREMNEELNIRLAKDTTLETIGTVRDFQSSTCEHLGIVMVATAGSVSVKEKDNLKGIWMTFEELKQNYSQFESWARHIIDYAFANGNSLEALLGKKAEK